MARAKRQRTKVQGVYNRDLPSGRVYDITYHFAGKKQWESGFPTQAAAQERLVERKLTASRGGPPPVKPIPLDRFIDEVWRSRQQARVKQGNLRSSALAQYERDLRLHIQPVYGGWRVDQIDLPNVQRFHDRLAETLAPYSVLRITHTLSGALDLARKHGYIHYNPVPDVEKVKARALRDPLILTLEQLLLLVASAPDPGTGCLILAAALTGARQSELFALRWQNVNLTENAETILIVEQYYRNEIVERTKTPAGMREIILAPQAADALRAHYLRLKMEGRPNPHDLVFPNSKGGYLKAPNFTSGPWTKARKTACLTELDFQDLRDFYVSHIRQTLPAALSKQLAGHDDNRTHDHYTHAIPGTETLVREALGLAFQTASTGDDQQRQPDS